MKVPWDHHQNKPDARAWSVRHVRRIGWDERHAPRSICGKTREVTDAVLPSIEVCAQKVNHDGPCFEWPE